MTPALFFRRIDKSLINKTCPISNDIQFNKLRQNY